MKNDGDISAIIENAALITHYKQREQHTKAYWKCKFGIYQRFLKMHVLNGFFLPKIVLKKFTIGLAIPHFIKPIVFKNKCV
jgi:hypothetical protein